MPNFSTFDEINEFASGLNQTLNFSKIEFYSGDFLQKTASVCSEICPYCKLVVLYTQDCFESFGEKFSNILKQKGVTPINVILNFNQVETDLNMLEQSFPENARLVVAIEEGCIFSCQALAKFKGVDCVIGLESFPQKLFNKLMPPPTHFVFCEKLKMDKRQTYSIVVSKIISLLDIKLKQFLKIIPKNPIQSDEFVEILDKAIDELVLDNRLFNEKLIEYAVKLELLEIALGHISKNYDIKTSLCMIKLIASNLKKEFFSSPNYLVRAERVNKLYGLDYYQTLKGFKFQIDKFKEYQENLTDIKKGLSALSSLYLELTPKIVKTFKSLGGVWSAQNKQILQSIKYAGDIHYYNNSMSLLRETGCLEQIK